MIGRAALVAFVALAAVGTFACGDAGSPVNSGGAGAAGQAGASGAAGSAGSPRTGSCTEIEVPLPVADLDLAGYPPYAVHACRLVYVPASGEHARALVERDLETLEEVVLAPASEAPRRPAMSSALIAWESTVAGVTEVHVRVGSETRVIEGAFDHAGEPRVADVVAFTGWLGPLEDDDTDVFVYDPASRSVDVIASGAGQQRYADVSDTHIALSDFSEDPGGTYDPLGIAVADVILYDRALRTSIVRPLPGKQAYPMLGAEGRLLYLEWTDLNRPVPKLEGYVIRGVELRAPTAEASTLADVETDPPSVRPSVADGILEWVAHRGGTSSLYRVPADGSALGAPVPGLEGLDLSAPAASALVTVIAARDAANATAQLRAVAR